MLLSLNYGLEFTTGIESTNFTMLIITVVLVILYVGSAILGLKKGMKVLTGMYMVMPYCWAAC